MRTAIETDGDRLEPDALEPEVLTVAPLASELDDELAPDAVDENIDSDGDPVAEVDVDPDVDVAELAEVEVEVAAAQASLDADFLDQGTLELLGIYLHEVRRFPLLSAEEEVSLARAYDQGRAARARLTTGVEDREQRVHADHVARTGERARRKLVESNLRLVISVARKHLNRGMPLGDLIQEGNIGLSRAVDKFDWKRGFRFSTYAYWWIRQAITRSIADQSRVVRIPVHMTGQISRYARASGRLAQELGREPTVQEVADWMDITVARAEEIRQAAQVPLSLDAPIGEEADSQIGDLVEDDSQPSLVETVAKSLLRDSVGEILCGLNPRERRVVEMRFGISDGKARTLAEVGDEMQISRERVRQIETDALRKLRRPTIRRRLAEYLG